MISLPPTDESIERAARAILNGEAVVYPTETLYGLGADALDPNAVAKVFALKQRPPDKPTPVLVASMEMAARLAKSVTPQAERLMRKFWPGPLTIILDASPLVPEAVTAGTGTVGIRITSSATARKLVEAVGRPITATSANRSGSGNATNPDDIRRELPDVGIIIDSGILKPGPGSTVVDARGSDLKIVRVGEIPLEILVEIRND